MFFHSKRKRITPVNAQAMYARLKNDIYGGALSIEVILVGVIAILGLLMGGAAVRDGVSSELSDIGGMTQDLNQSYTVFGVTNLGSSTAGMDQTDSLDHCDDAEDLSGLADNCITYDLIPITPIDDVALNTFFDFESGDASDTSPNGQDNGGSTVAGDPEFIGGVLVLDGNDALGIANSPDINIGIHGQRTILLDFNADDVIARQLLFEEGAGVRGLNIYIDNGSLYVGGWNIPTESGWAPTYLSTPITAGTWNQVALVLSGGPTLQPDSFRGYVNGAQFGSAVGSQLWSHAGAIGLGGVNGATIFHDGIGNGGPAYFAGSIDNFTIHNRALTDAEVYSANQ